MTRLNLDASDARILLLPEFERLELVLVGCGGTGSWLAPHVARIARLFHDLNGIDLQVTFIDKDRVEEKNTYRQNFVLAEIGHYKAETLAIRYSLSTGCNIVASTKPFAASDCSKHSSENTLRVFIGCVDNPTARRELERTITHTEWRTFCILLDCGNHKRSGQVIVGTTPVEDKKPFKHFPGYCTWLPKPSVWHKELITETEVEEKKKKKPVSEMSCAEIAMMDQQGLSVNAAIAAFAADYLVQILLTQNLNRFATYIDLDGMITHRYITPRVIRRKHLNDSLRGAY